MSSYANKILNKGERIIYIAKPHWITFLTLSGVFTLFIVPWVRYVTTEIVVTDKRVIYKTGLIVRDTHDINFNSTEMVELKQGIWGRFLDFGHVNLVGNGGRSQQFRSIANPLGFRRACPI